MRRGVGQARKKERAEPGQGSVKQPVETNYVSVMWESVDDPCIDSAAGYRFSSCSASGGVDQPPEHTHKNGPDEATIRNGSRIIRN